MHTLALPTLAEHRMRVRSGLEAVTGATRRLVESLTPEQLTRPPEPGQWSVLQCFDHLAVTNREYRRQVEPALARIVKRNAGNDDRQYVPRWHARLFMRMTGPRVTHRFPAPRVFRPAPIPAPDALDRFHAEQEWLIHTLATLSGVNDNAIRVHSPVTRLVRFTLAESFDVILGHEWRHLAQAERAAARLPDAVRPPRGVTT